MKGFPPCALVYSYKHIERCFKPERAGEFRPHMDWHSVSDRCVRADVWTQHRVLWSALKREMNCGSK